MIVGFVSLHTEHSLLLFPGYILAIVAALVAFNIIMRAKTPQTHTRIVKSQIFANLGALALLVFSSLIDLNDNTLFCIEILIDSLFHFASWCYVIVLFHRCHTILVYMIYKKDWTEEIPIVLCSTALILSLMKTSIVKILSASARFAHGMIAQFKLVAYVSSARFILVGSPLAQLILIFTMEAMMFRRFRQVEADNEVTERKIKRMQWWFVSQSAINCLPNLIFLILLVLIPDLDAYGDVIRSLSTIGLQIFDVVVDSLTIVYFYGPRFSERRTSLSMSSISDADSNDPEGDAGEQESLV